MEAALLLAVPWLTLAGMPRPLSGHQEVHLCPWPLHPEVWGRLWVSPRTLDAASMGRRHPWGPLSFACWLCFQAW